MAVYRHIHIDYWQDGFVLDLTPEEKYFYIYLMTNSKTSQCGIYELPKRIIETETGYNRETVDKLLNRFIDYKKIVYCEETREVFLMNWIKHNKIVSPKVKKCVYEELKKIKSMDMVNLFFKQCEGYGYTLDKSEIKINMGMDRVSIPIPEVESNFEYGYVEKEKENPNAVEINNVEGNIEFENVSFSYENESVLNDINLSIESGKMLALVGPSGGGKTTFCSLIPRFYDVDKGDIKIDGKSIYDIKLNSLRKNIGIVQQDVFLYTGTIKENIKYGNQNATDEEVIEAAKKANIHEFIMELKDGYDTYIGERGVKLSGGQKQRISIARVFLKNPPILILDEATSALDNVTEYLIQKSLEELCKNRTTIVVAHRLSTIKNADEIIVLTDKGIEERGSHIELIKKGGIYENLNRYSMAK